MTTAITTRSTKGSALTFTEMDTNFDTLAIQSLWVPVNAMRPSSSNGCALVTTVETTARRPDLNVMDFDPSSDEFAQFSVQWPNSWDKGTLTFKAYFTVTGTNTGTAGTTNTGGGGGGGANCNAGGAGGSGVVIIRYKFQ